MRNRLIAIALLAAVVAAIPAFAGDTRTTVFKIEGMHCSGCAEGIEAMVKRVEGVLQVEASFDKGEASVQFDPARTTEEKIVEAIEKLGYKATPKKA